jgi:hypothetical protein
MLFVILASFHETIPKQYVYSVIVLGFALVLAVIVGQALTLAGVNIPQVKGKPLLGAHRKCGDAGRQRSGMDAARSETARVASNGRKFLMR